MFLSFYFIFSGNLFIYFSYFNRLLNQVIFCFNTFCIFCQSYQMQYNFLLPCILFVYSFDRFHINKARSNLMASLLECGACNSQNTGGLAKIVDDLRSQYWRPPSPADQPSRRTSHISLNKGEWKHTLTHPSQKAKYKRAQNKMESSHNKNLMTASLMLMPNQTNVSTSSPAQTTSSNVSRTSEISIASSVTRGNIKQ